MGWQRWNVQVSTTFKRLVFKPLRKAGWPVALAGFVTFVCSGLFHEYQFLLAFPSYPLGTISKFFLVHGVLAAFGGEQLTGNVPRRLKGLVTFLVMLPSVPM